MKANRIRLRRFHSAPSAAGYITFYSVSYQLTLHVASAIAGCPHLGYLSRGRRQRQAPARGAGRGGDEGGGSGEAGGEGAKLNEFRESPCKRASAPFICLGWLSNVDLPADVSIQMRDFAQESLSQLENSRSGPMIALKRAGNYRFISAEGLRGGARAAAGGVFKCGRAGRRRAGRSAAAAG
ncbi:hypothetical protein EVAR_33951_1 [Eumeta japonica]|uniref:Uncharacterized protein n=1 Tax=Eumeta variegata TaxID=151549 RepID=A0A4C1VXA0_EUMVA|nr:hypothetical protein EVAR_33951_1 [Eumeta japonica]